LTKISRITAFSVGITIPNQRKDDIEFVTEFPCLLGHPVSKICLESRMIKIAEISTGIK